MSLLTLYSLFRVLNQQELINKKQVREQAPGAEIGEKIVYINENGERKDELPKNSIILFMPQENYETLIATKNAKEDCGHVKKRKAERHKASDENSDKEQ